MSQLQPSTVVTSNVVNDVHQGAIVTITAAFCIVCSFLFLFARLLIRWPWRSLFGRDDAAVTAATIIQFVQAMVTIGAVSRGLGTRNAVMSESAVISVEKMIYATDLLFILANYASKFTIALFFYRLSNTKTHFMYCAGISIACGVFCLVSIFVLAIETPVSAPWLSVADHVRLGRWIAVEAMSIALDLCIVAFPVLLVMSLSMNSAMKMKIIGGFGMRVVLIPIAIMRVVSFNETRGRLYEFAVPQVYLQAEMCFGVISATLPCLRIFLQGASPQFLGGHNYIDPTASAMATAGGGTYKMGSGGVGNSYKMSRISRRKDSQDDVPMASSGFAQTTVRAANGSDKEDGISMASDNSERAIVVRHTVNVQYTEA